MTEDKTVGSHHQLNGHEYEQAQGVGDGQGSLACCSLHLWDFPGKNTGVGHHWSPALQADSLLSEPAGKPS